MLSFLNNNTNHRRTEIDLALEAEFISKSLASAPGFFMCSAWVTINQFETKRFSNWIILIGIFLMFLSLVRYLVSYLHQHRYFDLLTAARIIKVNIIVNAMMWSLVLLLPLIELKFQYMASSIQSTTLLLALSLSSMTTLSHNLKFAYAFQWILVIPNQIFLYYLAFDQNNMAALNLAHILMIGIIYMFNQTKDTNRLTVQTLKYTHNLERSNRLLRESQKDLSTLNNELEQKVKERTEWLIHSEEQLRLITDTLPHAVVYIDTQMKLQFINETGAKWLGRKKETILGKPINSFISPAVYQNFRPIFQKCLSGEEVTSDDISLFYDHERQMSSINYPHLDQEKKIKGVISITTDITEQKVVENILMEAKLAADAANQAKSEFLANMSHEIRTPLGAVMGFAELIANSDCTVAERLNYVTAIKRNGKLLSNIISDILDLSKVEVGKLAINRQLISLTDILTDVETLLRLVANEKAIHLSISSEGKIPNLVFTDSLRLRQILINIIGNAIKFTERGSVEVTVKLLSFDDKCSTLAFVVKDTGCGISKENIEKLFKPFSQADTSIGRKFGGTGLGLILSRKLANLLGGDVILAESQIGKGSQFILTIDAGPLSESQLMDAINRDNANQPPQFNTSARLDNAKVLVVDDSEDNQFLISKFLNIAGAQVAIAENGLIALEKVQTTNFDLILMDLQMPVMDGYETTSKLRRQGFNKPIIALTAHAFKEVKESCLASGFDDYISKPINRHALIEKISKVINFKKASENQLSYDI